MQLIPGVEVTAVAAGSSKEKAEGFAKEHGACCQAHNCNEQDIEMVLLIAAFLRLF